MNVNQIKLEIAELKSDLNMLRFIVVIAFMILLPSAYDSLKAWDGALNEILMLLMGAG